MKKIIIQISLVLFCSQGMAQQAFTNNGNMQIHAGASLSGTGNFTNTSTGVLVNNGNLYLKGNTTNDQSTMATGAGTLYLNGSSTQSVNGSQSFKTYHLNTNNSSGITLNNNLIVSGVHTFTGGIITTSATPNYLVYESGASYAGDGDTRHVNGWIKKIGSTNFIFPVGNGTVERTIALNTLSVSSEFNAKYFANTTNPYQTQLPLWDVDDTEYWSIQKASGGTASVAMNWNYSKVYFPNYIVSDIRVAGYNGSLWTNNGGSATGNAATTGNITSASISSFNLFTFGSVSYVLPLTLVSFNATRQDNYTQIDWTTEKEYNADRFVVERSDDGTSFYAIAQLPGRNSGITELYNTRDNAPVDRIVYYRLRLIDINGRENLSRTVMIKVTVDNQLTLLTNPVHDRVTLIASPSLRGLFYYTITAMNGQLTQQGQLLIQNGGSYPLELKANLKPGIYTLDVNNGMAAFRYKIAVR